MGSDAPKGDLTELLEVVAEGGALTVEQAEAAIDSFMDGSASEVQMAGLLVGLRARGVQPAEVAGGVRALRKAMIPVAFADPDRLVDTAGTGGGVVTTFNISTASALVVAGAGVPVAKHGNRSFTSRCGSADVLEALGVRIELTPEQMGIILAEAGIVFMFAPLLHPAMRHVGPVRRGLGVATMMNILGPLTNPAGARRQVVGVADPRLLDLVPDALLELGHLHALVVHGEPGLDEVSPFGVTRVAELKEGRIKRYEISPADLGLESHSLGALSGGEGRAGSLASGSLAGGDPNENAALIGRILAGEPGAARDAVVANAAAALLVGDAAASWSEAARLAEATLDRGGAGEALERLRTASREAG
jgi:anthranilate phosphoribosyltransferase